MSPLNPLRYRGYVYDTDTNLYYLQSRYYNPEVGRFINADTFAATGQGFVGNNMFAYCNNNPLLYKDVTGNSAASAAIATGAATKLGIAGGVASGASIGVALPIVLVFLVVCVACDPNVQEVIATGYEYVITTTRCWLDELETTIENKLALSLEKAKSREPKTYHVHHIVAQSDPRAAQSRYIIETLFPYGVNNVINLILVSDKVHSRLHTNTYFTFVEAIIIDAFISAAPTVEAQRHNVTAALLYLRGFISALSLI